MANVNLKTDFVDGEKLFGQQLNNNFSAIQEALKTLNAITWQDNTDVMVAFRGTTTQINRRPIINGQLLYNYETGESYIDFENKRISTGSGTVVAIQNEEPTNMATKLWIEDELVNSMGTEVVDSLEGNEKNMAPSVSTVKNFINGTEWEKVKLSEGFSHNALSSSGDLVYKRIGNVVYIKGSVKGFTASGDVCGVLPVGFRPSTRIDIFFGTGGNYFAKGIISASGSITLLGDSQDNYSENNWYSICTSYITNEPLVKNQEEVS